MIRKESSLNNPKSKISNVKKLAPIIYEGLNQTFLTAEGKKVTLQSGLSEGDYWQTTGRVKRTILTHHAVQKIADKAGIDKIVGYTVLTQPDAMNNYQYAIMATITSKKHGGATEIGEANRGNLGSKGRNNPMNMAQKRAYDRAVFRLLNITGLLSEEELADEDNKDDKMEGLTHEERQQIAPIINQLLLATTQANLIMFSREMKENAKKMNTTQLDYIRKLYSKRVGELSVKKF